ncbi:E3 ubiquitin-protein ligase TRIM71-like [Saccostrea cucullata]|uniref:E3 ubiquitin-protein ligase TRIM71-like n=1 Tax=Saccostrea cuccullata TaxID=36930 RepID=UPI002ED637BF
MDPRTSAQDVMRCDLCETALVQMHCDQCIVNLCKACVGKHISRRENNGHKVVKFQDRKSHLYPECKKHVEQLCAKYCDQCDIPVCTKCTASAQHLDHKLSEVLQVVEEKRDTLIRNKFELDFAIYPKYQYIAYDIKYKMSQLEKDYEYLSTAITKHGEEWHKEIDKLVKKLKAKVDKMKNTQIQTLKNHLDDINKKISYIKDEIDSTEIVLQTNDLSKLLSGTSNINIYRNLPQEQEMALSLPKFIPREIIGKEFNKLFGALSCNSVSSDEHSYNKKKIQKSSETVINFVDTGYNKLYNVACLSDEEIWTSGNDSTIKLYSINQGSLLKSISTKSGNNTSVIGVTKAGDLVYSDYDDRTVNIVKNKETEEVIRLQNWRPFGVCSSSSGDLLVTMLSDDDYQSKVVPGAVVVVNLAGKLRFSYTGLTPAPKYKPFSPRGITTNIHNHILISDVSNDCVHIIDQDGEFISYIPCGLTKPWGLCTTLTMDPRTSAQDVMRCDIYETAVCTASEQNLDHVDHWVSEILQVMEEQMDIVNREQKKLMELNMTICLRYKDIASDVQHRMSQLEKYYEYLSTTIKKHGEEWHKEIDKIVNKLNAAVDKMRKKNTVTNFTGKSGWNLDSCVSDYEAGAVVVVNLAGTFIFSYKGLTPAPNH